MVFSTIIFLCAFLPITIIVYYLMPERLKNIWLLISSIFFYGWGEPKFVWIMLGSILCNYLFGIALSKAAGAPEEHAALKKGILVLAVIMNLGILFVFKYFTFTLETIRQLTNGSFEVLQIALPIGISFYTFQGLSYVVDVYRMEGRKDENGEVMHVAQKSPIRLALYIAMFPQLIAGPIVRYHDIGKDLTRRVHSPDKFAAGAERFIIGLSKKAILANMTGEMAGRILESDVASMGVSVAWLGAIAYTLQIYFDFSGYSDMAIGLGKIFGFTFLENFDHPYIACSIKEFWHRWHISLSGWFRDYLYIPLGGSRRGNVYFHLAIVFLATGIWHGAAWGFVAWGIWHGTFRLIEYYLEQRARKRTTADGQGFDNEKSRMRTVSENVKTFLGWLYTMLVVVAGWVIFAKVNLHEALDYLAVMFGIRRNTFVAYDAGFYLNHQMQFFMTVAILACVPWKEVLEKRKRSAGQKDGGTKNNAQTKEWPERETVELQGVVAEMNQTKDWIICLGKRLLLLGLLALDFVFIINSSYNPFIYFRF